MRVLAIAQSGTLGGAERSLLRLARLLPEHGIHIEIASPRGPLAERARDDGIAVHAAELGPVSAGSWPRALAAWPRLRRLSARTRPDVYLLNGVAAHRAVPALRSAPRVPYLHERLERAPRAWASERFWSSAPSVLCAAQNIAAAAQAAGAPAGRLRVVGAPVEAAEPAARPAWAQDGLPTVGFVGRLDEAKAPLDLLAALERLPAAARLVIVGGNEEATLRGGGRRRARAYAERVRAEAASHGERVVLTGPVDNAAALMPWFDVLAVPSRHEGLGTVAAEALAAGTPVVVTDAVGMAAAVAGQAQPCGEVVAAGDPAALAGAIERVLARRDAYARAAPAAAEPYSAERVAGRVAEALREAVSGP